MKKYIVTLFLVLLGSTSCNNFLDVSSPSKSGEEYVYSDIEEMNRVLTSVYASLLSSDGYGKIHLSDFALNSDVEFNTFTGTVANPSGGEFRRFDGAPNGSAVGKYWTVLYQGIERANVFIHGMLNSPIYDAQDEVMQQMLGEAKTLRAMFYHDLVVQFGDVPFTTVPSFERGDDLIIPVEERTAILEFCIDDLIAAQAGMKYANELSDGVKRASKEFAQGLIARIALTRGGYSLYPDKNVYGSVGTMQRPADYLEYYEIAKVSAEAVIASNTHALNKSFRQVFIDECNFIRTDNDDPIFEIPFLYNSSGDVGYIHGPAGDWTNNATTGNNVWGRATADSKLNAFYRYSFDREDTRLDYTVGMWYYQTDGTPQMRADYYVHNNKWSKFWTDETKLNKSLSPRSEGKTGIALPYMRYADVLLMYAEAVNELENGVNGPNGAAAKDALRQVRDRAFRGAENYGEKVDGYIETVSGSKESFFQAIVDERKWEFGGENVRWKDLVRWNLYSKVIVEAFMDYYMVALMMGGDPYSEPPFSYEKWIDLPPIIFSRRVDNPGDVNVYPNTKLQIRELYNPYKLTPTNPGTGWDQSQYYQWWDDNLAQPRAQVLYSFRGYIRDGENSNFRQLTSLYPNNLPPVRYILPFPEDAINRSNGKYKNYYGY